MHARFFLYSIDHIYPRDGLSLEREKERDATLSKIEKVPPSILFASVFSILSLLQPRPVSMIVMDAPLKQSRSVTRIPFITPDEDAIFDEYESARTIDARETGASRLRGRRQRRRRRRRLRRRTSLNKVECTVRCRRLFRRFNSLDQLDRTRRSKRGSVVLFCERLV
jgi:hypothetical protein